VESEAYWSEFGACLPTRARHFAGVLEEFGDGDDFEFAARALACEVLNTTDDVGAVFSALDD
jgi:hypothetical protein